MFSIVYFKKNKSSNQLRLYVVAWIRSLNAQDRNRLCCKWLNQFSSFNILLQPPVRYWQESPKAATDENRAEKDEPENDPKQTQPKKQKMQKQKKAQKTKKRKQEEEQPDGKTFLSGVRMQMQTIFLRITTTVDFQPLHACACSKLGWVLTQKTNCKWTKHSSVNKQHLVIVSFPAFNLCCCYFAKNNFMWLLHWLIRKWIRSPGLLLFMKTEWRSSGGKIKLKR